MAKPPLAQAEKIHWQPNLGQLQLLEALGEPDFFEPFLNWLHQELGADQCMIFFCADGEKVTTLLFKDFVSATSGKTLAESYVAERRYLEDPNFERLKNSQPNEVTLIRFADLIREMGPNYKKRYFDEPGFQDKLSVIYGSELGNFYINLYRRDSSFDSVLSPEQQQYTGHLLGLLVSKHYQLNQSQLSQGPLAFLSERERQVCAAVLQGKKNEWVAHELNIAASSVVTYRKRAYEKLGISSRAQLFALCQS
ncbi:regulatory protein, luxR family [Oceanospirillum multiglobuliferum]|uniref:HTH luxR-type domain-containing protein n=1 Tax=Oceanospirillum multiglobuliferum TaxID=64969 RepID=A0A1T4QL04_9GAMM|nr:helix-turn-helix transcriptional regulator [Oceanospirillum multiglobuliferum]OPX56421.1 hypothetical protein BTE48_03050 [Oceanospirillum multiglobuliferum]SKA04317.1 regulatory protein, luxR family [Oceanospirillum multiglobuliferum]